MLKGTEALSGKGDSKPKAEDKKKDDKKSDKKKAKKKSGLRSMHVQENHDGSFHIERSQQDANGMASGMPSMYSAATPEDLHDHIDDHFGPGEGEGGEEDTDSQPATSEPVQGMPGAQ